MQFPVPQFIDSEDKIIGPFGLKQFGIIFIGGLIVVAIFRIVQLSVTFFLLGLPITLLTLVLAFGSFNGKPLYDAVPTIIGFVFLKKRMIYHKEGKPIETIDLRKIHGEEEAAAKAAAEKQKALAEPPQSRLQRLSLLLDQKNQEEYEILKVNKK